MKYKKYPKYKDSGVEWIGDIPEGWEVIKLKQLGTIVTGNTPSTKLENNYGDEYLWAGPSDITGQKTITDTKTKLSSDGFSVSRKIPSKSIMVTCIGDIGNVGVSSQIMSTNQQINSIISKKLNPDFLYYSILSNQLVLDSRSNRTVVSILNKNDFGNFQVCVSFDEIEILNITKFLDKKTSQFDELIAKSKERITILEEKRQATINQAVTKGLDPSVKMKDSGVEWIGEIPEGWAVNRLKFLCNITTGAKNTEDNESEGDYPFFVRSQKVEKISTYSCDEEAVLTAGDGVGVGKVFHYVNGKFDFHQRVYKMNDFKKILGKYFFYYFQENFKKEIFKGTAKSTVDSIRLHMIQDFPISFGPEEEQEQIIAFLKKQITQFDELIAKSKTQITLLEEKRQALITATVTGKIDVRSDVAA
jgi:type I restriction enzyme S subunit